MCVVLNRALDTLLMHHVSLGIIGIVAKRPFELLGLYQKHVRCRSSVVPRVPDAAIAVLFELVIRETKTIPIVFAIVSDPRLMSALPQIATASLHHSN